ncbi:unnamed protein product, partial [Arabidopsis halleri]
SSLESWAFHFRISLKIKALIFFLLTSASVDRVKTLR